jgi:hypothetical protein
VHCVEIEKIFNQQGDRRSYIFRPGFESAKKVVNRKRVDLIKILREFIQQ